jgi:ABC-type Fe3+-citrate transport system substrate-binding protein
MVCLILKKICPKYSLKTLNGDYNPVMTSLLVNDKLVKEDDSGDADVA